LPASLAAEEREELRDRSRNPRAKPRRRLHARSKPSDDRGIVKRCAR
jgi:hypothetical protein